jgi:hypothetical protein
MESETKYFDVHALVTQLDALLEDARLVSTSTGNLKDFDKADARLKELNEKFVANQKFLSVDEKDEIQYMLGDIHKLLFPTEERN